MHIKSLICYVSIINISNECVPLKKITPEKLKESLLESNDNIFLYLGGHHFPQEFMNSAEDAVKKIDNCTTLDWTWKETELNDPEAFVGQELYPQGGLLVGLKNIGGSTSPLLDHFINIWANEQKGLLFTSTYSAYELDQHLKSILWIQGEEEAASKYRINLQNPDYQSTWLASFAPKQLQAFMGPISSIAWLEICGYDFQWLIQTNEKPELNLQKVGWYNYSQEQDIRYDKLALDFLHREVTSHFNFHHRPKDRKQAEKSAKQFIKDCQEKGISDHQSIILALKSQFYMTKKETKETIELLANDGVPLDVRIEIAEQRINQAQQKEN